MAKKKEKENKKPAARDFDIVRAPVITEKATLAQNTGHVAFYVSPDATKPEIKAAIERIFKVTVEGVTTLRQKGKVKAFKGQFGARKEVKKAYVRLAAGQSIDLATGV